jgi:transposase
MADKGKRRRRQFTPEFKRDAVELVRASGRPIAHIAAELGIYDSTLGAWVKQAEIDHGEREGLTSQDKTRLRELEAENARLRMERDLLKRRCPAIRWGPAQAEHAQPGQVDGGGQQTEVGGDFGEAADPHAAATVAAADQMSQLALDLGPGRAVVGGAHLVGLAGAGSGQLVL